MPVVNANSVDPDQTPRTAVSDLSLHSLPMSYLWDARHKWVKDPGPLKSLIPFLDFGKLYMKLTDKTIFQPY